MAKLPGVSRSTLRAGIRLLTAVGVLQSRQGILTALMNMVAKILFEARSKTVKQITDLKESAELAPACIKSAAFLIETPPVGINLICGSGAFRNFR